nr:DUF998 domain-containing protein [Streptomyces sp. CC210A]
MTPPPRGRGTARWPLAVLLALGAVTYSAWLLETVLGTGLDPVQSYVSELAATDQRLGVLFRTTDLVSGLLVLTAALGALARSERRPLTVAGWAALALFGAATAADSRLPLSCTPTADAACAAREDSGDVPFTHLAHAVSSSLAMAAPSRASPPSPSPRDATAAGRRWPAPAARWPWRRPPPRCGRWPESPRSRRSAATGAWAPDSASRCCWSPRGCWSWPGP